MTALAVVSAALAVLLLVRPPARVGPGRPPRPVLLAVPLVLAAAFVVPRFGALLLVLAGGALGGLGLWRRRRRRREAARVAGHVLETCELLAGELAAGRPPGAALDRAAA